MSTETCGYALTNDDGEQHPCDRPAIVGEHEDMLDAACDHHENDGGALIAASRAAWAEVERLAAERDMALDMHRVQYERANRLEAERDRIKRGAETLGHIVTEQGRMALDATGRHDVIGEDGDGDWGAVWEWLAELRPRAEKAEAETERLRGHLDRQISEARRLQEGIETLLTDLKKADAHHFSIGLMGVRLRALLRGDQ